MFSNTPADELATYVPEVDAGTWVHVGTAAVRGSVAQEQFPSVLAAYNPAIASTFYIAAGTSACGFFAALLSECRSVKRNTAAKTMTD